MSITCQMACGHSVTLGDNPSSAPVCSCGEHRVTGVKARPPSFSGACRGPYAVTKSVTPAVVNLASAGPLKLKEQT